MSAFLHNVIDESRVLMAETRCDPAARHARSEIVSATRSAVAHSVSRDVFQPFGVLIEH